MAVGIIGLIPGRESLRLQGIGVGILHLAVFAGLLPILVLFLSEVKRRYISPHFR